jgi:tetratricopeptide (TPR) repeat protein
MHSECKHFLSNSYDHIGSTLVYMGKYEEALVYMQKALEIELKLHGNEHESVAFRFNNMATVYLDQGNHVKAKEIATKAYHIFLKVLGPDHPHTQYLENSLKHHPSLC